MIGNAKNILCVSLCAAGLGWSSCSNQPNQDSSDGNRPLSPRAETILVPARSQTVSGKVMFTGETNGVRISTEILGLRSGRYELRLTAIDECFAASTSGSNSITNELAASLPIRLALFSSDYSGHGRVDQLSRQITLEGPNSITNLAAGLYSLKDDTGAGQSEESGELVACGPIKSLNGQACCGQ